MSHSSIKAAEKLLPASASKALKDFLKSLYKKVPAEDLDSLTPEHIAGAAQKHWDMSQNRAPDKPAIDIYTTKNGNNKNYTVIDIVSRDMAFLVDSVAAEISRHNRSVHILLHPVMHADYKGKALQALHTKANEQYIPQSHMHILLKGAMPKALIKKLEKDLVRIISDVDFATRDWLTMKDKLRACQENLLQAPGRYDKKEIEEYTHFLEYLYRDNFTLLGYREYKFVEGKKGLKSQTIRKSSLGLFHNDVKPVYLNENDEGLPQELQHMRRSLPPVSISKVNRRSTVHRPVYLDAIAIKRFDKKGKVIGECLFIGLFTSVTYSRSIQDIPLLRYKADQVMQNLDSHHDNHDLKALRHVLEKYPRDELFQIKIEDLKKTALSIIRLQERQRIALYMRKDLFRRYISCLVYIPRDRFDTKLRLIMAKILESELGGTCDDYQVSLDDSALVRVLFTIKINQNKAPRYNGVKIERRLEEAGRAWSEKLAEALQDHDIDEQLVPDIVHEYGEAFSLAYIEEYETKQAVYDIEKIKETKETGTLALDLYQCKICNDQQLRLKVYSHKESVVLSDILPILENMGLRVLSEVPFEVRPTSSNDSIWIHDFLMEGAYTYKTNQIADSKDNFEEALLRIWSDEMANDGLNHLILGAGLNWRDVMILRTLVHYLKQTRFAFSTRFIERTLYKNAKISSYIIDLFKARHNPDTEDQHESITAKCAAAIDRELEKVESLEEDKILRTVVGLVHASLRTNFFQPASDGDLKAYLAIKFDSQAIEELPDPKPYREIFVYSPRVEGIHLRGDVIARGGIRWSDRFEDFRTEVLGLMKAQQVKNSLIVPMGAKGGFIVKKPPQSGGRQAYFEEGIACYKTFIRALLEITDNRKGKRIVPPRRVVRHDGDDPYLVVAADKGTASFSDIANSLSDEFDFWLGDAFASGGSAGYDHKIMGITARGAWESVKRHFRELNHDTQTQDFDVVGVGDMGGDVFGNGMLLSEHIRLIGAFNHLHIFCDPEPDTASSFKERQRLFKDVKGWGEYNTKKLSKGGRIFERSEKSLELTPEIKKRFDIESDRVTPFELIQAMLKARTDLLWFGGIGTYIKGTDESHADVGDKANDYLRINAQDVKAKVLGEGANLAITQKGRMEFSEKGGKLNADFIDNSGGVNSSDVEVNIKILMGDVMGGKDNKMTLSKRNKLLEQMTIEVAELVLTNNYQQAQAISLMEMQATQNLPQHARLIEELEEKYGIAREIESLPDKEEIEKRLHQNKGLSRPEICTIQAYTKINLTKSLLASDLPDKGYIEEHMLFDYFPAPLRKKYAKQIKRHRLHREIIATAMATDVVNHMGPTFVMEMQAKTGASSADVIRAYFVVREAFELPSLWSDIEDLDNKVPAAVQLDAMLDIARMAERECLWFLTRLGREVKLKKDIESFREGIRHLRRHLGTVVTKELAITVKQRTILGVENGLPNDLAHEIALIRPLGAACDIIRISMAQKTDMNLIATVYYELGDEFHLHWLRKQARFMRADDEWSAEARENMVEQLYNCQAGLTIRILSDMKKGLKSGRVNRGEIIESWVESHVQQAEHLTAFFKDVKETGSIDLPILMIAEQRLRQLYGG